MGKYTYKPQYGVIVICTDEKEQQAIYERLKAEGLTLKEVYESRSTTPLQRF